MRRSFFCLIWMISISLFSQERTTIKDPEIEFSFDLPAGWETQNDDYYFYVFNPEWKNTQLTITYYNENTPRQLEEIVDTRLRFSYPDINGFKHLLTEPIFLDEVEAFWVSYKSRKGRNELLNREYIFIKEGQVFYLLVTSTKESFKERIESFHQVVKSFRCSYR